MNVASWSKSIYPQIREFVMNVLPALFGRGGGEGKEE